MCYKHVAFIEVHHALWLQIPLVAASTPFSRVKCLIICRLILSMHENNSRLRTAIWMTPSCCTKPRAPRRAGHNFKYASPIIFSHYNRWSLDFYWVHNSAPAVESSIWTTRLQKPFHMTGLRQFSNIPRAWTLQYTYLLTSHSIPSKCVYVWI